MLHCATVSPYGRMLKRKRLHFACCESLHQDFLRLELEKIKVDRKMNLDRLQRDFWEQGYLVLGGFFPSGLIYTARGNPMLRSLYAAT